VDYVDCCCREISDFKVGGCKIAKLFAKHFKVSILHTCIIPAVILVVGWILDMD